MRQRNLDAGRHELKEVRRKSRKLFWTVGIFSFFVNMLMLTGPIFMLQVYDRVLGSRSEETLLALFILVAFLFGVMGILDFARGRILARIGADFQERLDRRVFAAVMRKAALTNGPSAPANNLRDLEAVQRLLSSPVLVAMFDIPWTPIFLAAIMIFHPWLGWLAIGGGLILICVTALNQALTRDPMHRANTSVIRAERVADQIRGEAEMVQSLGMMDAAFDRWKIARNASLYESIMSSDRSGGFSAFSKTFRLFLQSAMLGLGAYLVLRAELTPGAMIASSILMGRALAPVDLAIGQWGAVQRAREGWHSLIELLSTVPQERPRTALPRPKARLHVDQLTVIPPEQQQAALRMLSFDLEPGKALGVIGPSGAGKSTLARALTGVWRPASGKIRLDGAAIDQYDPAVLGQHIGYLPQRVELFEGTIAENIARLSLTPDPALVVEAAKKAAAHEMILRLPDGYDTVFTGSGARLSGGQMQRIGLARAMYGNPVLLVLDEPNSNLDNEGTMALNSAIRRMKEADQSIIIMAHRPAAIQECELLLVIDGGIRRAFGPTQEVLKESVKNHQAIMQATVPGGVS